MEKEKTNCFSFDIFSNKQKYLNNSYSLDFYSNQTIKNKTFHQSSNYFNFYEDNKTYKLSYSNFYSNLIKKKSISTEKVHVPKKIYLKINDNKKITFLDKIENNFNISKNINKDSVNDIEKEYKYFEDDFSLINKNDDNFFEESSELDNLFTKKIRYLNKEDIIQKCTYLLNNYEKLNNKSYFKNTYLRCPLKEEKENDYKCECIPLIKRKLHGLLFICEKKYDRFFDSQNLLKLILDGELFIQIKKNICYSDNNNIKKKINCENNINNNDKILSKYNNNNMIIYKNKKNDEKLFNRFIHSFRPLIKKIYSFISYKHYEFNKILMESNKINNDNLKKMFSKKIVKIFINVSEQINYLIYYFIIKRLILEYIHKINGIQSSKYKNTILQNISLAQKEFEYLRKKKRHKRQEHKIFKIIWIIEFYFKEEIKSDIDKIIFISITLEGYVIIYSFNFLIDLNQKSDEEKLYKVINKKRLDILEPQKIVKLKCFNINNNNNGNNYFLLSSPHKHMAQIINVKNNFKLIENYQIIDFYKGLYSSVEFYYSNSYYLLNISKGFTLWFYEEKSKFLDKKVIKPKLRQNEDKNDKNIYRLIKYIENKKLFIVQIILPINSIEFYTIDQGNKEFNIILIKKITFEKERNSFSFAYNSSCLIKDKYLLIGAVRNEKNGSDGGIYIINLDKFQCQYLRILNNMYNIYSLLNIRDNIIICISEIYFYNEKKKNKLNYNIINYNEKNEDNISYITAKNNEIKSNIRENNIINNIKDNNYQNINIINDKNYDNHENNSICNNDNYPDIYDYNFNYNNTDNSDNISIIKDINNNFNISNDNYTIINNKNINCNKNKLTIKNNNIPQKIFRRKLILFELIENKNETININIKEELFADFLTIDCNKMIFDSFLLCSYKKTSSMILINKNNNIFNLFNIDSPFDE